MCFLNVCLPSRFGFSRRYHQIQLFFQQVLYSQTWIIYSEEFSRRWRIISLHGYYGISGKLRITKFSVDTLKLAETESILLAGTNVEGPEDSTTNNEYNLTVDSRKMVLYRWLLERGWYFFRTRLVQHFIRFWWIVGGEEC